MFDAVSVTKQQLCVSPLVPMDFHGMGCCQLYNTRQVPLCGMSLLSLYLATQVCYFSTIWSFNLI